MNVCVMALSYKRIDGLTRLLEGIEAQELPDGVDLSIVIVDNDPDRGAEGPCAEIAARLSYPLQYHHEPRRGIAYGRNTAVAAGRKLAEWLAFIDDDEVPDPRWIAGLVAAQEKTGVDVVSGPVLIHFPEGEPDWARAHRFFHRKRHADLAEVDRAFTNNVLFRAEVLEGMDEPFAVRYALMGCEDVHFFRRLHHAGRRICWADQALVTEWIPASRATPAWCAQRMYRVGTTTSVTELDIWPGAGRRANLLARAVAWALIGVGRLPAAALRGLGARVHARRAFAYAWGLVRGVFHGGFEEYRQTHGS